METEREVLTYDTTEWRSVMRRRFPKEESVPRQLGQALHAHRVFRCFHRIVNLSAMQDVRVESSFFRLAPAVRVDRCIRELMRLANVACRENTQAVAEVMHRALRRFNKSKSAQGKKEARRALMESVSVYISVLIREELTVPTTHKPSFRIARPELPCMWDSILLALQRMAILFANARDDLQ